MILENQNLIGTQIRKESILDNNERKILRLKQLFWLFYTRLASCWAGVCRILVALCERVQ